MHGQVIGINSAILSRSGGNVGIGFAVPSNLARNVYQQLIEHGRVSRGYLGVTIQTLTPELAASFGIEGRKGALVAEVTGPDTPAARAGLKPGDVIVQIDGEPVESGNALSRFVSDKSPGSEIELQFYRGGELETARVELSERPTTRASRPSALDEEETSRLGIVSEELTPELASQLGASSRKGVVIAAIEPQGAAAAAGLRRGDIVVEANRREVSTPAELERQVAGVPEGGTLLLRIERVGTQAGFFWVSVELDRQ